MRFLQAIGIPALTITLALCACHPAGAQSYDLVDTNTVRARLRDTDWVVVDVRGPNAFIGWPTHGEKRGGHIPGAANVAVSWVREDLDGIADVLKAKGIVGHKEVLLYGVDRGQAERMADLLVARHGVEAARLHVYADGFLAWSARTDLPVDRLPRYDRLVPATWLAEQIKLEPDLLVFEVSWRKRGDYERRHIPGARYLDTDLLEVGPLWNILPPDRLAESLTSLGIAHDVPAVLYGEDTTAAARAAVVMLYAGVKDVRLLNGGLAAWQRAGLPVETGWVRPIPVRDFGTALPAHPEWITGIDRARELLSDPNSELVSIRSWEEYVGNKSGYLTLLATGRIRGAVWGHSGIDSGMSDFRNPDNTMRDYGDIVGFWGDWGITPEKRLGFYCGTGWRASEAFFYAWLMGWDNITVYDGGWFEWSDDGSNPVAAGDPRFPDDGRTLVGAAWPWNLLGPEAMVRLAAFTGMLTLMALWEALAPRRRLRVGRRRWSANLALAFLNTLVVRFAVPLGTYGAAEFAAAQGWGLFNVTSGPQALEFVVAVLLMDLVVYLQHRLFHAVPLLWRFHKVHHADNDFDVTTGLRFHTVSMVLSMVVKMSAAVLLGASPLAVLVSETALNLTAMFNHANISIPVALDQVLRWLIVTPDMHRVHHSAESGEMNTNFGFNFPWWDRLLGTYRDQPAAGHQATTIGLREHQGDSQQGLLWMITLPLRPR